MNITAEKFFAHVGRMPENDDLDRCNCPDAGDLGHWQCGWCKICQLPQFICGCAIHRINAIGMKPAYKPGTLAKDIIVDGWSRGFNIGQTMNELIAQGFGWIREPVVQIMWTRLSNQFARDMAPHTAIIDELSEFH